MLLLLLLVSGLLEAARLPRPPLHGALVQAKELAGSKLFITEFSVGQPKQKFRMVVELFEADFWLASCACHGHNGYDPDASSTYVADGRRVLLDHRRGRLNATLARDQFFIQDVGYDEQCFGLVAEVGGEYARLAVGGGLGLGWPRRAQHQPSTSSAQDILGRGRAAFIFFVGTTRTLAFGARGNEFCGEDWTLSDLNVKDAWLFQFDGFQFGPYGNKQAYTAAADFNEDQLRLPELVFAGLVRTLRTEAQLDPDSLQLDCDRLDRLPPFQFLVANHTFVLPAANFFTEVGFGVCGLQVQPLSSAAPVQWVLGMPFLRSLCTLFDFDRRQIGFVNKRTTA